MYLPTRTKSHLYASAPATAVAADHWDLCDQKSTIQPAKAAVLGPSEHFPLLRSGVRPLAVMRKPGGKLVLKGNAKKVPRKRKGLLDRLGETSLQDAADMLGTVVRGIGSMLPLLGNIEEKYFDVTGNTTTYTAMTIASAATALNLTNIAQGSDYLNRLGNSIRIKSIRIDFSLIVGSGGLSVCRVIVFRDLMQAGVDPTPAQLLEVTTQVGGIHSPYLHYDFNRFDVVHDKVYTSVTGDSTAFRHERLNVGVQDHCEFQGTTGADASNWQGAWYILFFDDQGTNHMQYAYSSRTTFVDN